MSAPTCEELHELIETDLADSALQALIDAEEAEVVTRFGEHVTQVDQCTGGGLYLYLNRPALSITSVVERIGTSAITLAASDYTLRQNSWTLERLTTGTNSSMCWTDRAIVTYVPKTDTARRKRVITDLVRLAIQYTGLRSESDGDYSADALDYQKERDAILSTLRTVTRMIF